MMPSSSPGVSFATLTKGESRVRVVNEASPIFGQLGTYIRRVYQSSEGWVRMDAVLPPELQSGRIDKDKQLHYCVLFPDEVEAVQ